jgi:hypothetical protein
MLAIALVAATLAAPVPKNADKDKIEKRYGTIVDREKDCKFELGASH